MCNQLLQPETARAIRPAPPLRNFDPSLIRTLVRCQQSTQKRPNFAGFDPPEDAERTTVPSALHAANQAEMCGKLECGNIADAP
jgi:hypothetical protein